MDKEWHREYSRRHYRRKKEYYQEKERLRRARMRAAIRAEKEGRPCVDCGISHPWYVLQFDHVRGLKEFRLAIGYKRGVANVASEIAKCGLVCANCHAERTYQRAHRPKEKTETL